MKKAFIYVGHSNWGKSFALKQITNGSSHKKTVVIKNKIFFVRKMSNDDNSSGLLLFSENIPSTWYQNFILAYCPNHEKDQGAMNILNSLQKSCELYFFVQESKYSNPSLSIPETEITYLQKIGKVQILKGHNSDTVRASKFHSFIEQYI
jgi:hypothetical protein